MAFLWNRQMFLQVFSKKVCFCCILGCFAEKKLPQMSQILTDGACLEWILRSVGIQFSHGLHWSTQMVGCVSGCVGTAGCHTLLHLCKSVQSVGDPSLQEASVKSVNSVGENHSKKVLCRSVKSVGEYHSEKVLWILWNLWEKITARRFCEFCEFCGRKSQREGSVNSVNSVGGNHSEKVLWILWILWEENSLLGWCSWDSCTPWELAAWRVCQN